MTEPRDAAPPPSDYDQHYAAGGFGYEDRRDHWLAWARRHYADAFGLPRGRLLDVGCGDGFWTSVFAELGFSASGIDQSPGGIAAAQSRYPGIPFLVVDADEPLPFEAGSFDVVFCRAISHFGAPDLEDPRVTSLVTRLMTLLAPDGVLLASYHTTRDGAVTHGRTHHPASALVRLLEHGGDPYRVELVGNYVQVGAVHRGRPARARSSSDPASRTPAGTGRGRGGRLRRALGRIGRGLGRRPR
jgi:SAM-dependent methyltransferase